MRCRVISVKEATAVSNAEINREKLLESVYRRAEGYTVEEKLIEYVIDEEGNRRAVKEKTQNKHYPPDVAAAKAYIELLEPEGEFARMTDEELEREKKRLLGELASGDQSS